MAALASPVQTAPQPAAQEQESNDNRDLPEQLKKAILAACRAAQEEDKYARRVQAFQSAKNRIYDIGIQHIYNTGSSNGFTQAIPGTSIALAGGESVEFPDYIDDYNIFHAFALIPQAKLAENAPGIDFQPINPNDTNDVAAAKTAEYMRHEFDRNNDLKQMRKDLVYYMEMDGIVVRWTRTEDSYERYGTNQDGSPRRHGVATTFGVLESKLPIFARDVKDFPYAIIYLDTEVKMAKYKYGWIKKSIRSGCCLAENAYERVLRLSVMQSGSFIRQRMDIGDAVPHTVTEGHFWLRHCSFIDDEEVFIGEDGNSEPGPDKDPKTVFDKIVELFPRGVHAVVVGESYAQSFDQSMDDCIDVGHGNITSGQSPQPLMKSMVLVQDRFNSTMNFIAECFDYGAPSIWVGCDAMEFAAFQKQHSSPYALRNYKGLAAGENIANKIYREEQPEVSESQQKYMEFLSAQFPQFLLAVPPSIWGAAMKDQKTSSGYHQAIQQAMGVLATYWAVMASMDATMYYQNCLAITDDPKYPQQLTISGQGGRNIVVDVTALQRGDFRAYPDIDSGFPESTADKRASLDQLITTLGNTPMAAQVMGSPANVKYMARIGGHSELVIPEADSNDKQIREIDDLLKGSPIIAPQIIELVASGGSVADAALMIQSLRQQGMMQSQAAMQQHAAQSLAARAIGQPEPETPPPFDPQSVAKSSVTILQSDYHIWEAKTCRDWLSSDECNTEIVIGRNSSDPQGQGKPNVLGVLNVLLHWQEHNAAALAEAPQQSGPLPAPNIKPPGVAAPPSGPPGVPS